MRLLKPAAAFLAAAASVATVDDSGGANLVKLSLDDYPDAQCLDGTPGAFYFQAATEPSRDTVWEIYFQGGGWCYDEEDCLNRAQNSALGTSDGAAATYVAGGLLSDSCSVNPSFCNVNKVFMHYCDGNSFTGDLDGSLTIDGVDVFFRGKRILDAVLDVLTGSTEYGLSAATDVLLTGCSAGGLAAYLHADYIGDYLASTAPDLFRYKVAPISGFFLNHETVENKTVYGDQIQYAFDMQNSTAGVPAACVANQASGEEWKCNFAAEAYKVMSTPVMVLNSALDSWQTSCIYASEPLPKSSNANGNCSSAAGWEDCANDPDNCTEAQLPAMNTYLWDFVGTVNDAKTSVKAGNAAFLHSCHTHCEGQNDADYTSFQVGHSSMQEAVETWWSSEPGTAPVVTVPCQYGSDSGKPPYDCNPSCGGSASRGDKNWWGGGKAY